MFWSEIHCTVCRPVFMLTLRSARITGSATGFSSPSRRWSAVSEPSPPTEAVPRKISVPSRLVMPIAQIVRPGFGFSMLAWTSSPSKAGLRGTADRYPVSNQAWPRSARRRAPNRLITGRAFDGAAKKPQLLGGRLDPRRATAQKWLSRPRPSRARPISASSRRCARAYGARPGSRAAASRRTIATRSSPAKRCRRSPQAEGGREPGRYPHGEARRHRGLARDRLGRGAGGADRARPALGDELKPFADP